MNRNIVVSCTIAIVIVMLGTWLLSIRIAETRPGPIAPPVSPPGVPPEFGVLEQKQFTESTPHIELDEGQRRLLQSYGWNDRAHTSARVPIWRAEQLLLARGGADAGR